MFHCLVQQNRLENYRILGHIGAPHLQNRIVTATAKRYHCEIHGEGRELGSFMKLWLQSVCLPCYSCPSLTEATHELCSDSRMGFGGRRESQAVLHASTARHPKLFVCCSSRWESVRKSLAAWCGTGISISSVTLCISLVKHILFGRQAIVTGNT